MITLYGIPNCDTVKKARAWLNAHGVAHTCHDFKRQGVPVDALDVWLSQLDWAVLVNRKGTTWRQLDDASRASVVDAPSARALMLAHASVIKRPVVQWGVKSSAGSSVSVGFDAEDWAQRLRA